MSNIQLLRHATIVVNIAGKKMLVDPMLAEKEAFDPVPNSEPALRIPMVDLPLNTEELTTLVKEIDAIFVTHTHPDHWDPKAQEILPKDTPLFCQAPDEELIKGQGFTNVTVIADKVVWEGITIHRFGGVHGTGELAKMMGPVSGFVFEHNEDKIYVAGDTIWHEEVVRALDTLKPQMTVLNAGGAQFVQGDPITMTPEDIAKVHQQAPNTKIVAIHMDTVNHCNIKRTDLQKAMSEKSIQIEIPADGEVVSL
ncbi:MAG TPA: hypothetical protein DCS93_28675 [Microscillaceae bacterium]|nr:hypothetical protein [Microscillaceae bacterium]